MTERSTHHATFVIDRSYDSSPARVFGAFAKPEAKARWFVGPAGKWTEIAREFDFRVGGRERLKGGFAGGPVSAFDCLYWAIVPDERIVYTYDMHLDEKRISVSLATVEIKPEGTGTRLIFTEQGAFLDGHDTSAQRKQGTGDLLDALGGELRREDASA